MTTSQLEANQENARRSTVPIMDDGKARSSQNALRHGLTAKTALLPTEDPEAYARHSQAYFHRFAPQDEVERQLVQQLADIQWRLLRIPGLESTLLENCDVKGLSTLSLYEQRLLRTFERTLAVFRKAQEEGPVDRAALAPQVRRSPQVTPRKEDPKNGFVCSTSHEFCPNCSTWEDSEARCEVCGLEKRIATPSVPTDYDMSPLPEAA